MPIRRLVFMSSTSGKPSRPTFAMPEFEQHRPRHSGESSMTRRTRSARGRRSSGPSEDEPISSSGGFPRGTPQHVRAAMAAVDWLDLATAPTRPLEYLWGMHIRPDSEDEYIPALQQAVSGIANERQRARWHSNELTLTENIAIRQYTFNSNDYVNDYLRDGTNEPFPRSVIPPGADISAESSARRARQLAKILEEVTPANGPVALYRGGHGNRGTSGEHFRQGIIRSGDVLVNSDFLSFTENPFTVAKFIRSWFNPTDDTSIIFQLSTHHSIKPIAPFTAYAGNFEDESLCPPMRAFRVRAIDEIEPIVNGLAYPIVVVSIEEMNEDPRQARESIRARTFDFRTGECFDFDRAEQRLAAD